MICQLASKIQWDESSTALASDVVPLESYIKSGMRGGCFQKENISYQVQNPLFWRPAQEEYENIIDSHHTDMENDQWHRFNWVGKSGYQLWFWMVRWKLTVFSEFSMSGLHFYAYFYMFDSKLVQIKVHLVARKKCYITVYKAIFNTFSLFRKVEMGK
jgi:hypothetical protein